MRFLIFVGFVPCVSQVSIYYLHITGTTIFFHLMQYTDTVHYVALRREAV
jgi:hypothetical protein